MNGQKRQEEDYRWDPESAYAKSGSRRLIAFILLVIAAGAAAILYFQNKQQNFGEVELNPSMRFEEADRKMQEAGYIPVFKAEKHGSITTRYYEGRSVLGQVPAFTVLEHVEGKEGGFRVGHSFEDAEGSSSENPGQVYLHLEKELAALFGGPETRTEATGPYLVWPRKNSGPVLLGYMADGIPMLYFIYYNTPNSL